MFRLCDHNMISWFCQFFVHRIRNTLCCCYLCEWNNKSVQKSHVWISKLISVGWKTRAPAGKRRCCCQYSDAFKSLHTWRCSLLTCFPHVTPEYGSFNPNTYSSFLTYQHCTSTYMFTDTHTHLHRPRSYRGNLQLLKNAYPHTKS